MATIETGAITMADLAKVHKDDASLVSIVDALRSRTTILEDMLWKKANMADKHRITRYPADRTSAATLTQVYEGVDPSKLKPEQIDEHMCMVHDASVVDVREAEYYKDVIAYRNDMDTKKLKDIGLKSAERIFQGNMGTDAKDINGFQTRQSTVTSGSGGTTYSAGGSAALTSIYLVNWNADRAYGIYPMNSKTFGVEIQDKGEEKMLDANNKMYWAWITYLKQTMGIAVQDDKAIGRIANIATGDSDPFFNATATNVMEIVNQAVVDIYPEGKLYAYLSPLLYTKLLTGLQNKSNFNYDRKTDDFGREIIMFNNIHWRIAEQVTNSETQIS